MSRDERQIKNPAGIQDNPCPEDDKSIIVPPAIPGDAVLAQPVATTVTVATDCRITSQTENQSFHPSTIRDLLSESYDHFDKINVKGILVNVGTFLFSLGITGSIEWINGNPDKSLIEFAKSNFLFLISIAVGAAFWLGCKIYSINKKEEKKKKYVETFVKKFEERQEHVMVTEQDVTDREKHVLIISRQK